MTDTVIEEYYKRKAKDLTNILFDKGFLNNELTRESIDWLEDYLGFVIQSSAKSAAKCAVLVARFKGAMTMSEAKHTPGPWTMSAKQFVDGHGYTGHIICANSIWIGDVHGVHVGVPENEIEANAKLIAAAPDLLNELQHAANMLSAVAGDIEDGVSGLRGKYITALINARDNAMAVIRKATS